MRFIEGAELKCNLCFTARIGFEADDERCRCLHFKLRQEALRSRVAGHLLELMEQKASVVGLVRVWGMVP